MEKEFRCLCEKTSMKILTRAGAEQEREKRDKIDRVRAALRRTNGKFFTVAFLTREDRTRCVMNCRTVVRKDTSGDEKEYSSEEHNLVTVWENKKHYGDDTGYRNIPLENVKEIRCKEGHYFYEIKKHITTLEELDRSKLVKGSSCYTKRLLDVAPDRIIGTGGIENMYIKREVITKQIKDARDFLIKEGICAIDGSGDPTIEAAMNHLSLLADNKLSVSDKEREFRCQCGETSIIVHSRGTWYFKNKPCCDTPHATNF